MSNNSSTGDQTKIWSQPWIISLGAVLIAHLVNQFSNIGWRPLVVPIREALNLTTAQSGALVGIAGVVSIIAAIPAGTLCNKFGEKAVLLVTFVLSGFGMIMLSLADSYSGAMVGRSIWQFFYRMSLISTMSATAIAVPQSFKGRAMGLNGSFANIGALSGGPLGAWVALTFGWQRAFWVYAGFLIIGMLAVGILFKPYVDPDAPKVEVKKNENKPKEKSVYLQPAAWAIALLMFFCSTPGAVTSMIPLQFTDRFAVGIGVSAIMQSVGQGLGIVINPLFGTLADKIGRFKALIIMLAITTVMFLGLNANIYYVFVACGCILQFMGIGTMNLVYACGGDLTKGKNIGAISGVVAIGTGVAQYFLGTILGSLKDSTGTYFSGHLLVAGMSIVGIIISWLLLNYINKRDAAQA